MHPQVLCLVAHSVDQALVGKEALEVFVEALPGAEGERRSNLSRLEVAQWRTHR